MSLERVRREIAETKRDFEGDIQSADVIAESKKRTMVGLESITSIPDEGDRQALERAMEGVRTEAKGDFARKVDDSISEHTSRSEGIQGEAQGFQNQVNENANAAKGTAGSADYGRGPINTFAALMAQRGQEYGSAISELQKDVQDAKQRADARRNELDS